MASTIVDDLLLPGHATTTVTAQSSAASKQTAAAIDKAFAEVQSPAPTAPAFFQDLAFGSPAPLDAAAKMLSFEGATKPTTPAPEDVPAPDFTLPDTPATPGPAVSESTAMAFTPAAAAAAPAFSAASSALAGVGGGHAGASSDEDVDGPLDYEGFMMETLLWENKVRSAVWLVGGLLAVWALHRLATTPVNVITGVCWLVLGQVALNFTRGFVNPKLQARCTWRDSALVPALLGGAASAAQGLAELHDKHLVAPDAPKLLRVAAALWAVSLAARAAGAAGLAAALWVLAFAVPKAYSLYQPVVDATVSDVLSKVQAQVTKLDPRVRAALVAVPTFTAGLLLGPVDTGVALLLLALYGRSAMAQAQVDKVNAAVAPVSNTVSKVGGTVGNLIHNAVVKYELTPTPAKRKRE